MDPATYEPEGPLVVGIAEAPDISNANLVGKHVTLTPLLPSHAAELYLNVGGEKNAHLYKYMPNGPYFSEAEFTKFVETLSSSTSGFFPFVILSDDPVHVSNQVKKIAENEWYGTAVGIICYLNIAVPNRSIEIGSVLYAPTLQRTTAATETTYLLMKHAFDDLGFLRVEWKCNDRNKPSSRAALRLGFVAEGTFRAHMVIKGKRRDTDWFSVIEEEWGVVKSSLEEWMGEDNFEGGQQRKKLEEIRESMAKKRE